MAVPSNVAERIQVWATLGRSKKSFGAMNKEESALFDALAASQARYADKTIDIVAEMPDIVASPHAKAKAAERRARATKTK
jgi:hypothetical protein